VSKARSPFDTATALGQPRRDSRARYCEGVTTRRFVVVVAFCTVVMAVCAWMLLTYMQDDAPRFSTVTSTGQI
jgi:hypothetical protein